MKSSINFVLLSAAGALAGPRSVDGSISRRDITGTSNVWLGQETGNTAFMASGVLLGLPLNGSQIPDHWLADIGFWNMRSGGSQLGEPARGWTHGYEEFMGRYLSMKSDYEVTRRFGGRFQIMLHDMWGQDSWPSAAETPMPGDNGDYSSFDAFMDTLFTLCIQDGIVEDVWWDIWNEPDNGLFMDRGLDRYLEYYIHAHNKIVNDFPEGKTTGPSFGRLPNFAGDMINWFTEWASTVAANNAVPDMISVHFLYDTGDLNLSLTQYSEILGAAGINYEGTWNIQEYGNVDQQIPSTCAWNMAQLERHNAPGLRANWQGALQLHDYLANLISKPEHGDAYVETSNDYFPAREYPLYIYYYQKMKGMRVASSMTEDTLGDTFAVINPDDRRVRVLAGTRPVTGTWTIKISNLSAVGLPTQGQLPIQTWVFNTAATLFDQAVEPVDLGYSTYDWSDDTVSITINQADANVAYAYEFSY